MQKEYLKIYMAQLKLSLGYDQEKEFLIADSLYFEQMGYICKVLSCDNFDIVILPELSYHEKYNDFFLENSKNRIIVFGSVYINNSNYTVVFHNQQKHLIKKEFCSGVEPAIRFEDNISVEKFIKEKLKQHTFKIYGKKFIVLNCAEYYKSAYLIARNRRLNKDLFGFLVPCANNNNEVFITESMAIHNHNESIYSFIANSVATYNGLSYSFGRSYIFGPISSFEKDCLNTNRLKHPSNICCLGDDACIISGLFSKNLTTNFYRSDNFKHTPKNLKIEKIGE